MKNKYFKIQNGNFAYDPRYAAGTKLGDFA